ncbi:MAG: efflux RND transporter permease subunit [Candidatus Omnitrophica bacterium]|nr:efflux RND transporter permease subunit [Candidatus Omnitrophota bacterium]
MSLSDFSIRKYVMAWMVMGGLMIFGLISYFRMGVSQLPNIDFPIISVNLTWEGAAPEVMESDVVNDVEQAIMTVQGVKEVSSSIQQGQANITIELELGRNLDVAVQEVQTKINQAQRNLPKDLDPPIITKVNPADQPIVWIGVTADRSKRDLMEYVEQHVRDKFTSISGVGEVMLGGYVDPNLRVWLDVNKLNFYQLTVQDVMTAIQEEHSELPAGRIENPKMEQSVRFMGEAKSAEEFGNIIITKRAGQPIYTPIYIKDVARIEDGLDDIRRISRFNGKTNVGLGIRKQSGVNDVAVAHAVFARLKEVQASLPQDVHAEVIVNRTKFIEDSIRDLSVTLILSALVTSLVCWFFLGAWSATLNILLAIPTSILGTFIVIYFLHFTLNTFTVLALSLAVGIVVDDSIMVLENIVRYRESGESRVSAASHGANQITGAAFATTMAMTAIFVPIVFISGIMGKFFFEFGVTISVAVWLSLLEALMLTPMRCSQFLQTGHQTGFGLAIDTAFRKMADSYKKSLSWVLLHRVWVMVVSFVIFCLSLTLAGILPKEFVPPQDQSMFMCSMKTPPGASVDFTNEHFLAAEKFVSSRPEVKGYLAVIGGFSGGSVNSGIIFTVLKDPKDRPVDPQTGQRLKQKDLMTIFRKELNKLPDIKAKIQDLSLSGFSAQRGFPVEFSLRGPDWDKLVELEAVIEDRMEKSGYMVDVDSDYQPGAAEIRIVPDRKKANDRGVSMTTIGEAINALVGGERVGKYSSGDRRYDVRVRLSAEQRLKSEVIDSIWVWNNRGERVALKDVVTVVEKPTALTITRRARERAISVFANMAPGKSQLDAINVAQKITKEVLPPGYRAVLTGSAQTSQESSQGVGIVFLLGILVAYMVLGSQYNSFRHPFIVLLALPFSISGAFLALFLGHQTINLYSMIGLILLMGIVKKNSIMMVDFTNQLRAEGKSVDEALSTACPIRLRPILMTSVATIAAAIPPAMAMGAGSEVRAPMAIAVIGGVLVSTFFTLFVIPGAYRMTWRDWLKFVLAFVVVVGIFFAVGRFWHGK